MEHPGSWFWLADNTQPKRGAMRLKLAVMDVDVRRKLHRQPWIDGKATAGASGTVSGVAEPQNVETPSMTTHHAAPHVGWIHTSHVPLPS